VRIRSRDGNFRFELDPNADVSELVTRVPSLTLHSAQLSHFLSDFRNNGKSRPCNTCDIQSTKRKRDSRVYFGGQESQILGNQVCGESLIVISLSHTVTLDTENLFLSRINSGLHRTMPLKKPSRPKAPPHRQADLGKGSEKRPLINTGGQKMERSQDVEMPTFASTALMPCVIIACRWSHMTGNTTKSII
jgi:hypothetical protein